MGEVCSSCPWDMTLKNIHTHTHTHTHPHSQTASKPPINRQELIFPITQSHHSLIGSPPHLTPLSPRKPLGKQRNGWCGCIGVVTLHPHTVCQLLVVVNSVNAGHSGVNVSKLQLLKTKLFWQMSFWYRLSLERNFSASSLWFHL